MTTMDFFGHQEAARRATRWLVGLFVLAVLGIVTAVYFAGALALLWTGNARTLWQPGLLAAAVIGVVAVVAIAAAVRTGQLSAGGPAVATMLGGQEVPPGTTEPQLQRLRNVVEEMALASGVPVPRVFVLAEEGGINAFAAGWGTRDAAIAVTRGALDQLDRDELQGVIAHEFSHVFHGDMRLNIRLMGVLFGIVCLSTIGEILLRTMRHTRGRSDRNPAAALALFGLLLMVIGWIGSLFAGLIKAAVSRQREFLADAAAVAYTRNPRGIGMALARIGRLGSRIARPGAREASHMFFADGVRRFAFGLGATHPPIEQRVERILPGFLRARARGVDAEEFVAGAQTPAAGPAAGQLAATGAFAPGGAADERSPGPVRAAALAGLVGTTSDRMVAASRQLLASLPLEVLAAARDPERAMALAAAMLLQGDDDAQASILQAAGGSLAADARTLAVELRRVPHTARLPVVELLVPALRLLPPAQITALHRTLDGLARADGVLTTFEFALLHTIRRHAPSPDAEGVAPRRALPLVSAAAEVRLVLSLLAHAGSNGDADAAGRAFAAGRSALTDLPAAAAPTDGLLPRPECRFAAVEQAMARLEQLSPMAKKLLIDAAARTAAADGIVQTNEGELLRAFAESWGCPLPPLWGADDQPAA